jgi:hypothetical protein
VLFTAEMSLFGERYGIWTIQASQAVASLEAVGIVM